MATLLYRIGQFSFRRAWIVILAWALIAGGVFTAALALGGTTQESFAIPGTESQQAIDRLGAVFPQTAGGSAQVVLQVPDGESVTSDANTAIIEDEVAALEDVDGVRAVVSPFSEYAGDVISDDESTVIIGVQFELSGERVTDETLEAVVATGAAAEEAGFQVEFGGQPYQNTEYGITVTELLGVAFAAVVLIITFGSLLAAGMPLLTALVGVGVTMGGVLTVAAFTSISSATPMLALMIGLAVGIDYALFILSRHRTQMANGMTPLESAGTAVATAGSSVVFAGVTVIIALLGLLVVGIPFLSAMGVSAAFAVLLAILVSITLLPALLGLAGNRLAPKEGSRAWKRAVASDESPEAGRSMGSRWVTIVMKKPLIPVIAVIAVLGVLAIPAADLKLALPSAASEPQGTVARDSYDLITEEFGPGYTGPLIVLVDITQTTDIMDDLAGIRSLIEDVPGVATVGPGIPNETVDTAIIQVVPESGPDTPETAQLVAELRELGDTIADEYGLTTAVTGTTAVQIDISTRLNNALLPFGLIVVGLSILLLMMVFRSVFVPIKAAFGFLLSVLASFGIVVAIFQWGFLSDVLHIVPGPILSFMPILLMAVLFGLAMDYEVFLVSGMREEFVRTGNPDGAIRHGFTHAARVVTAAALIMFFVFFAFVPEGAGVIKVIALGLAVGIAIDAFLVRMTLVPAAMALAGKGAWWLPKWLDRLLPNVDIEGEGLREHREAQEWVEAQPTWAISSENLVLADGRAVADLVVERGTIVQLTGDVPFRRTLEATLAGRLTPGSGQLQVLGHPLPSESGTVLRSSTMIDTVSIERAGEGSRVGSLIAERVSLAQPWYRAGVTRNGVERAITRLNTALGAVGSRTLVLSDSDLSRLPALERAATLLTIALAERTALVIIDQADGFADENETRAFLSVVERLTPTTTTVIVGLPDAVDLPPSPHRSVQTLDLSTQEVAL